MIRDNEGERMWLREGDMEMGPTFKRSISLLPSLSLSLSSKLTAETRYLRKKEEMRRHDKLGLDFVVSHTTHCHIL